MKSRPVYPGMFVLFLMLSCGFGVVRAQQWQAIASMQHPRCEHSTALLNDGTILIVGGHDNDSALSSCELYDPLTDSWSQTGSLNRARYRSELTVLNDGRVLITGGLTDLNVGTTATCEIYDPTIRSWSYTTEMSSPGENFARVKLPDGRVILAGGLDANQGLYLTTCDIYDPVTAAMQAFPPMLVAQFGVNFFYSTVFEWTFLGKWHFRWLHRDMVQ